MVGTFELRGIMMEIINVSLLQERSAGPSFENIKTRQYKMTERLDLIIGNSAFLLNLVS